MEIFNTGLNEVTFRDYFVRLKKGKVQIDSEKIMKLKKQTR